MEEGDTIARVAITAPVERRTTTTAIQRRCAAPPDERARRRSGAALEPAARRAARPLRAAAQARRAHAVLPRRGGLVRSRHARADAPAPVLQGPSARRGSGGGRGTSRAALARARCARQAAAVANESRRVAVPPRARWLVPERASCGLASRRCWPSHAPGWGRAASALMRRGSDRSALLAVGVWSPTLGDRAVVRARRPCCRPRSAAMLSSALGGRAVVRARGAGLEVELVQVDAPEDADAAHDALTGHADPPRRL